MSKSIRITSEIEAELREAFEQALSGGKFADGRFSFTKSLPNSDRKATIIYTADAWEKQCRILKEFDKEVAWHGVCHRGIDQTKDEYFITDILVYPQTVGPATVEMDTEEYAKWLMEHSDDERFDHIHSQMHSHVNMGTTPSSVDLNHQEEILNMLGNEDFYIFMIWNKSLSKTNKIYDLAKNTLFEDKDITVVVEGQSALDDFIKDAKAIVKNRTYTSTYSGTTGTGGQTARPLASTYQPYNPMSGSGASAAPQSKPLTTPATNQSAAAQERPRTRIGAGWAGRNASQAGSVGFSVYGDDDYNSPFFVSEK